MYHCSQTSLSVPNAWSFSHSTFKIYLPDVLVMHFGQYFIVIFYNTKDRYASYCKHLWCEINANHLNCYEGTDPKTKGLRLFAFL